MLDIKKPLIYQTCIFKPFWYFNRIVKSLLNWQDIWSSYQYKFFVRKQNFAILARSMHFCKDNLESRIVGWTRLHPLWPWRNRCSTRRAFPAPSATWIRWYRSLREWPGARRPAPWRSSLHKESTRKKDTRTKGTWTRQKEADTVGLEDAWIHSTWIRVDGCWRKRASVEVIKMPM